MDAVLQTFLTGPPICCCLSARNDARLIFQRTKLSIMHLHVYTPRRAQQTTVAETKCNGGLYGQEGNEFLCISRTRFADLASISGAC